VGDGLRVGVGEGLAVGVACATCFGPTTAVQATTTAMIRTTAAAARAINPLGARANIGRHDTRYMQTRELTVQTGGQRGVYDLTDACAGFLDDVAHRAD